jgi:hypothetical protein
VQTDEKEREEEVKRLKEIIEIDAKKKKAD